MARLQWNSAGSRNYESGIDRGVLYVSGQPGVAWNGLTSVQQSSSGGGTKSYYLDGNKYLLASTSEEFGATINAYTFPPEFAQCDGSTSIRSGLSITQQRRKPFGLSYRTKIGNDLDPNAGYKIHIIYNALAEPSDRDYRSDGDDIEPSEFSWAIATRAPVIPGFKRTAHVEIDSRTTDKQVLGLVEDALYGNDEDMPRLPSFQELVEMYDAFFVFVVTDEGEGIYTISGPDDAITALGEIYLQFDWPTVEIVDEDTATISSG